MVLYCATHSLALTLLGALAAGTFGGMIVNVHGAALVDRHGDAAPAAVMEANGFAAGWGLLAPLMLGFFAGLGSSGPTWRGGLLLVVPLALGLAWLLRGETMTSGDATQPIERGAHLPRTFWLAWGATVACIALEFVMTFWASDLLQQRAGMAKGSATAAISAVVLGLAVGRLLGSRLAIRWQPDSLLLCALGVNLVGFLVFWTSSVAWLSVSALFVVGLGLSMQYPLCVVRVIAASAGHPDLAASRLSLGSGLAVGVAPFTLGFLADHYGTSRAYLFVPGLVSAAVLLVLAGRTRRCSSEGFS